MMTRMYRTTVLMMMLFLTSSCTISRKDTCKEDDKSLRSDCTLLRDVTPPVVNGSIEIAAVTSSSIVLSWNPASDDKTSTDQLSYKLVVGTEAELMDSTEELLRTPPASVLLNFVQGQTSFEYTGLSPATTYVFAIVVRDEEDNFSIYQPVVQKTFDPAVSKPESFAITESLAGDGQATLSWNTAAGASSYLVRRGTSSGLYRTVARVDSSPYVDKDLSNGTTYYYRITAENSGGWTDSNAEVSVTPSGADTMKPGLTSLTPATGTVRSFPSQIEAVFSESMQPLTAAAFALTSSGCSTAPAVTSVTGSDQDKSWTANLSAGTCSEGAQLTITVTPSNLLDLAGNSGEGSAVTRTLTLDTLKPTISFDTPSRLFVNQSGTATIDTSFFDAILSTLSNGTSGIAVNVTDTASCSASLSSVSLTGARVTLSNCTGEGTVRAKIAAGVLTGSDNSTNDETLSSTITVDNRGPIRTTVTPEDGPIPSSVVVSFGEPVDDVTTSAFTFDLTQDCSPPPSVTAISSNADKTAWTVTLSTNTCTAFTMVVDNSNVVDRAGNTGSGCLSSNAYGTGVCFVGHTLITTPQGPRPLWDLKPGDEVLSYNFKASRQEVAIVQELTFHKVHDVTTLIHKDQRTLIGASRHRLLDLKGGSTSLHEAQGIGFRASNTRLMEAPVTMYDLVLDRNHNFFANGFLVESIKPHERPKTDMNRLSNNFCLRKN